MKRLLGLVFALLLPATATLADMRLLMAQEAGCTWCARWDDEVAAIYPKTSEGKTAPLLRYDIHDGVPDDVILLRSVHFTPTFVLLSDNQEVGRIEGYPGEDFFWGLLAQLITQASELRAKAG
jgi:hypothetical protein